jgi:Tfp pilus assembly protein PilF
MYRMQGKVDAAAPLIEEAYEIASAGELGSATQSLIANNLATLRYSQGRYEEAKELFDRVLAATEKDLGPDHPQVAMALNNLGVALWTDGKSKEAVAPLERALAIQERVYGPDHPEVAATLRNLVDVYATNGQVEKAVAARERVERIEGKAAH